MGDLSRDELAGELDALAATPAGAALPERARPIVSQLLRHLEAGDLRAAERGDDGTWRAVPWVKRGILVGFRLGGLVAYRPTPDVGGPADGPFATFSFVDKDTYPVREVSVADGVRVVPGGSSVRRGAHLARGVVCMPPMYINVGAYVGEGTMVDSHALVGSCAQIGARVHLSAAAQIGGVLEPVNASPVVIEDDVMVGGNCGVYEGTVVREKAVLAAGVILTRGTPVFDLVRETVHRGSPERPLEIPAGAVVVPGARAVRGAWAADQGLSLQTPVIVKYRDEKTDLATALEGWLR
ncbi:MAG: 2,3,4,5-tetrahydropyridine-2,6-dicarboxylate N-succinyltransferase [Gemmatimonadaceae bacterium]|nr:2,3,4,5-tetrahydropyridine-2,6-dicarboxylate N-succinyltransferase [Gemmatimonadaceae bacterium]